MVIEDIKRLLAEVLDLGDRAAQLEPDSLLLEGLPEFDSMAVATIITALEERFDIIIDDEDLSAEVFQTLGSLSAFVSTQLAP